MLHGFPKLFCLRNPCNISDPSVHTDDMTKIDEKVTQRRNYLVQSFKIVKLCDDIIFDRIACKIDFCSL